MSKLILASEWKSVNRISFDYVYEVLSTWYIVHGYINDYIDIDRLCDGIVVRTVMVTLQVVGWVSGGMWISTTTDE